MMKSVLLACCASMVFVSAAQAQVEEIVVTAQKKVENLQRVPIAITALSGDMAAAAGVRTSEDLNAVTPGLNLGRSSGGAVILLRGVGALTSQAGQDASVPLFVDGVYQMSSASALLAFNNIERVEVLKGPQGTLYGRNASGGAINIVTRTPSQDTAAEMEFGYGNYDTVEGRFYGTTGLAQNVAMDLALYYSYQGKGWGTNRNLGEEVGKRKDFSARSKLLLEPGDTTRITIAGNYSKGSGSTGTNYRPVDSTSAPTGQQGFPYGFYDTQGSRPFTGNEQGGISAHIDQEVGNLSLVSISAWQKARRKEFADLDTVEPQIIDYYFTQNTEAFTQEVQLQSDQNERLRWIVGAFFLKSKEGYEPFVLEGLGVPPFATITQGYNYQKTTSYAAFGQATADLTDTTRLTAGVRYTIDKRSVRAVSTGEFAGEAPGSGSVSIFDVRARETFKKPTWRIGIDHDLAEDTMAYFTYSRGFKSGIFNLSAPDTPAVRPEVLDAFELGLKSTLFDRRLRFNASTFYYSYKDIQAANIVGGQQFLRNAAKAEIYGVDVDLEASVTSQLTLRAAAEYLHARYKKFEGAPFTVPNPNFPYGNTQFVGDASGNRIPRAADWSVNLAGDYTVPLAWGELGFNVNYAFSNGWKWEADNRAEQKPFHIVNAQIRLAMSEDRFAVRLWARNLLAEKYYAQVQAAVGDLGVPAPPRTYGVSVSTKF